MNTVFIGGSRHVSRLPVEVKERLDNIISSGHRVIVGDANGADKAAQKHFAGAGYDKVTVYCSGEQPRNNLGHWSLHRVAVSKKVSGFQFYAAKDRQMAQVADFGLMIWDGKSPGTILNVLRLIRAGKKAVLLNVSEGQAINIKSSDQWEEFIGRCSEAFRSDLRERATDEEWQPLRQASLLDEPAPASDSELAEALNAALASDDPAAAVDALGNIAKARGMSKIAKDTGLSRESLYRSLSADGNPEFATVLKVMSSLGLRLTAAPGEKVDRGDHRP